jgi:acyl carrier protein
MTGPSHRDESADPKGQHTYEEVFLKLRPILAELLILREADITPDKKLVQDLDADSIVFLELNFRLRNDFGIDVPDPKVDEETLSMGLVDGLEMIERREGDTTMFEFMRSETEGYGDTSERVRQVVERSLAAGVGVDGLIEVLEARERGEADGKEAAFADWCAFVLAHEGTASRLAEVLEARPELVTMMRDAAARRQELLGDRPMNPMASWRALVSKEARREQLRRTSVAELAEVMGTTVPRDIHLDATLSALKLRTLFDFISVDAYVRYILFMKRSQGMQSGEPT